jgi:hypothetical protein
MRLGFGALFGIGAAFIFSGNPKQVDLTDGVLLGVLGYLTSYYVARFVWFRKVEQENARKIYTTGIGSYAMLFVFSWVLLFTLFSIGY